MTGWGLAGAALIAPPLAFLSAKALVPLLALGVLLEVLARIRTGGSLPRPPLSWAWPLLALVVWGGLSALWSVIPERSATVTLALAGTTLLGLVLVGLARDLDTHARERIGLALCSGMVIAAALFAVELASNAALHFGLRDFVDDFIGRDTANRPPADYRYVLNNGATVIVLMSWPASLLLWQRYGWLGALPAVGIGLAVGLTSDSGAAAAAALGGLTVLPVALLLRWFAGGGLAIALAAAILIAPAAVDFMPRPDRLAEHAPFLSNSAYHRLLIWDFTSSRINERPLLGWGLDGSRAIPGGSTEIVAVKPMAGGRTIETRGELLPLHPHNAPLQIWLELGVIGALLAALFAVRMVRAVAAHGFFAIRAAGLAQITAGFTVCALGYGLWQSWWLSALWLSAACFAALAGAKESNQGIDAASRPES